MPNLHYINIKKRIEHDQQLYKTVWSVFELCFVVLKIFSFVMIHLAVLHCHSCLFCKKNIQNALKNK